MPSVNMVRTIAATAVGAGALVALAACARGAEQGTGPMAGLTNARMNELHPDGYRGPQQLSLATDSIREARTKSGALQGTYDGTRLLRAADDHAYGSPAISTAADVKGDGIATFNEVRQVMSAFDADGSHQLEFDEVFAFEAAVGIRWTPAGG